MMLRSLAADVSEQQARAGRDRGLLLDVLADGVHHPFFVGELPGLELGVDQVAIDRQLEAPAASGDQFQLSDLLLVRGQQLARQTDGLRLVPSHRAILEFQIHCALLRRIHPVIQCVSKKRLLLLS
jgi:hypothetical protein